MVICSFCGTSNNDGTPFCAACGRVMGPGADARQARPAPGPGRGVAQRTVFGMPAPHVASPPAAEPPAAAPAAPVAPARSAFAAPVALPQPAPLPPAPAAPSPDMMSAKKTVFGMPGVGMPGGQAVPVAPGPPGAVVPPERASIALPYAATRPMAMPDLGGAAPAPAPSSAELPSAHRTVLGVPTPAKRDLPSQPAPPPATPPSYAEMPSSKRTVLGVPTPASRDLPSQPAPPPAASAAAGAFEALPSSKRTMLGVPMPGGVEIGPPAARAPESARPQAARQPAARVSFPAPASIIRDAPKVEVALPAEQARRLLSPTFRLDSTQRPSVDLDEPAPRSRTGMVIALIIGVVAAVAVTLVLVFQDEIFGGDEEPVAAAGAPSEAGVVAAGPSDAGAAEVATEPARIDVRLEYPPDGADAGVRLLFGAITSERPVKEIRLATGPTAGTPEAGVVSGKAVPASDLLPEGASLAPGPLEVPLDVFYADGAVERVDARLVVPYTFHAGLVEGAAEPTVRVAFRVVPGVTLEVAGAPVEVAEGGEAAYEAPVEQLRGREGIWTEAGDRVDLSLPFETRSGEGDGTEGVASVTVPVTRLLVDFPADGALTTSDTVWVRGQTAVGATVTLDAAPVTVNPNGTFAVEIPLPDTGTVKTMVVTAKSSGALARTASVGVRRTTPAQLRADADAFAAAVTDRLDYGDFAAAATSFQGRKVVLSGMVRSTPEAKAGVVSFVLFVDTASGCEARAVCAVLVQTPSALPIQERSLVRVLGEVVGMQATTSAEFPDLPAVRAEIVLPR